MGGEGGGARDRLVRSAGANVGLFCRCAACGGLQTAVFTSLLVPPPPPHALRHPTPSGRNETRAFVITSLLNALSMR